MTVTTDKQYIYPPNFAEGSDTMGDNVRHISIRLTGVADDATELTNSQVVDKSDLRRAGVEPSKLILVEAEWSVSTFDTMRS